MMDKELNKNKEKCRIHQSPLFFSFFSFFFWGEPIKDEESFLVHKITRVSAQYPIGLVLG